MISALTVASVDVGCGTRGLLLVISVALGWGFLSQLVLVLIVGGHGSSFRIAEYPGAGVGPPRPKLAA